MYQFKITPIELTDIKLQGNSKYNSNNHGNVSSEDYLNVLSQSNTEKWIDLFKLEYIKHNFDGTNYFVKVNNVSLKHGINGIGPYNNIQKIIESSITCMEGHTPLHPYVKKLDIYLIPWVNIEPVNEYRVFVCNNKIGRSEENLF